MNARKLPSGNWRVRICAGKGPDGKYHYKSFTGRDRREVMAAAAAYQASNKEYRASQTVGACIDSFLASRSPVVSPSTMRGYTSIAKELKRLYGPLCASPADRLTSRDAQVLVNGLARKHSPKTVRNYTAFLSSALKASGYNLPDAKLPPPVRNERLVPDVSDVRRMIELSKDGPLEIPILLAVTASMRRGEICGLTLDDMDGTVAHIHSTVVYDADQTAVRKSPKTLSSDRYVALPPYVAEKIREEGTVTDLSPAALSELFTRFMAKHDFPHYTFHSLRHFSASYLHEIGVPDQNIMSRGGWSTDHIMKSVYRHELESAKNAENKKIDTAFRRDLF